MTTKLALSRHLGLRFCGWLAACALATTALMSQTPSARIRSEISSGYTSPLKVAQHPWVQAQNDAGRMPGETKLTSMTLVFNRTPAQQSALNALIAAQQDPTSPQYHQWLTPEQFGARFGMAPSDLAKVQTWLEQQGFSIDNVARGRTFIQFSGTAAQFEVAFQTQLHYYQVQGNKHFAPSTELAIPTAFASTVETIRGVSDFKPHSFHIPASKAARPQFTSSASGSVFFAPQDIYTVYDINPLLSAGNNGTGQTIAIMGQSQVEVTDIENFQAAAGLSKKDPTLVYVPGTGPEGFVSGDEGESDLDLEWSSAMAPGATIYFVYAGQGGNSNGVFDSIQYAIDQKIGDIISVSYGACETSLGTFNQESLYTQAATQGQTIIAASGDQGSTACFGNTNLTTTQQEALAINYPASSPSVVGIGGTEISAADDVSTNSTYWIGQGSSDVLSSAKTWIPEIAWNDDAANVSGGCTGNCLSSSGGGTSTLFPQPSYQSTYFTATGEANPSSSHRLVPDIAFYSSPGFPGYLYCTSDQSDWGSQQTGSCGSGFRASTVDASLTVAGGTSFATPIFAGMLAILNQKGGYTGGQGLFNTELYKLASNSATYAAAFHDVTSGNNDCAAGTTECSGTIGFNAVTGYDEVTGLGSLNLGAFATALPAFTGTVKLNTTVSVSATPSTPALNANDSITIAVTSVGSSSVPGGNIAITVDSGSPTTAALAAGAYTYTAKFTTAGVHTVAVQYAGDSTHQSSSGAVTINIPAFTITASNVTVSAGSTGTSTITVTPQNGYTGTVQITQIYTTSTTLTDACSSTPANLTVTGTSAVTETLTIYTNSSNCNSTSSGAQKGGSRSIIQSGGAGKAANSSPASRANPVQRASLGIVALLLAALIGWRFRSLRAIAGFVMIAALGLSLTACGGGSSSGGGGGGTTGTNAPKGTYTLVLVAVDTAANSSAGATGSFTLTIQ